MGIVKTGGYRINSDTSFDRLIGDEMETKRQRQAAARELEKRPQRARKASNGLEPAISGSGAEAHGSSDATALP